MNYFELFSWMGTVCLILGAYFIAKKRLIGLVINTIGAFFYMLFGILIDSFAILFLELIMISLSIYGIINWRKKS